MTSSGTTRPPPTAAPLNKLNRAFYQQPAIVVAQALIGSILVRRIRGKNLRARIVETEAYIGQHDLACHASKGCTPRTQVMFGEGGHAYVYLIYGMHHMLNIVSSTVGDAQAVLIRAAEPLDEWDENLSGPGRLARGFKITRKDNALDLTGDHLFILANPRDRPRIISTPRIGVDYAMQWKNELLRFIDAESPAVSKPRLGPAK